MELGSLADWVTGIAEMLAVVVALLLPIISDKVKAKKEQKRLYNMTFLIAEDVLREKKEKPDAKIHGLQSFKHFKTFITFSEFLDGDKLDNFVFDQVENVLLSLDTNEITLQQADQDIKAIRQKNSVYKK